MNSERTTLSILHRLLRLRFFPRLPAGGNPSMQGEMFCEGVVLLRPADVMDPLAFEAVCAGSEVVAFEPAGLRRMALRASG